MRIELPPVRQVRERPAPVMIEVITGNRWLNSLEPMKDKDQVGAWRERSLFTLDEASGLVTAETDYGSFSYFWPPAHRSRDLFTFLADLDFGYFMGKAAKQPYQELDLERTMRVLRTELVEARRRNNCTRAEARDRWTALAEIDADNPRSEDEFLRRWYDDRDLVRWYDGELPPLYSRDTFGARHFWDVIWATLIASEPFRARMAPQAVAA